ncbi:hypothetical protein LPJ66_003752 [Kickxella alabastrina]|uniref:Uncharacterized protein n=1 Tax=Kickxella alabastrina TaxID=61397 RepID=A0ACC1IMQ1_9FUNG|nr:hypothetical protein LPJ66_003752 [Kickxella alabastrina]
MGIAGIVTILSVIILEDGKRESGMWHAENEDFEDYSGGDDELDEDDNDVYHRVQTTTKISLDNLKPSGLGHFVMALEISIKTNLELWSTIFDIFHVLKTKLSSFPNIKSISIIFFEHQRLQRHYHGHYRNYYRSESSGQFIEYEPTSSDYDMFAYFAKLHNFSLLYTWVESVASGVSLAPVFLTTLSFSFPKLECLDAKYPSHALRLLEAATFPPCLQHLGVTGTLAEIVAFDWTRFKKIGDLSVVVYRPGPPCAEESFYQFASDLFGGTRIKRQASLFLGNFLFEMDASEVNWPYLTSLELSMPIAFDTVTKIIQRLLNLVNLSVHRIYVDK